MEKKKNMWQTLISLISVRKKVILNAQSSHFCDVLEWWLVGSLIPNFLGEADSHIQIRHLSLLAEGTYHCTKARTWDFGTKAWLLLVDRLWKKKREGYSRMLQIVGSLFNFDDRKAATCFQELLSALNNMSCLYVHHIDLWSKPFKFLPIGNLYHRFNWLNKSWKLKEMNSQLERVNPIEIKPMLKPYTI